MLFKKAQSSEFIGIAVLVTAIVLIAIFTRMQLAGSMTSRAESLLKGFRIAGISTTGSVIPYVTINGIPIEELIGVYSCYGNETVDYGNGIKISIPENIRITFDKIYGKDGWALFLKKDAEKNSYPLFLSSTEKSGEGKPSFSPYISYDFRFPKPCSPGAKGSGVLFVVSE